MTNLAAAAIMFGFLSLVPYLNLTILRTEAAQMHKQGVLHQPHLDSYLNEHNALAGRFDLYDALARYLYGQIHTASPFITAACMGFIANAILIGVFWKNHSRLTIAIPENESPFNH
jgi:hypothetical protein